MKLSQSKLLISIVSSFILFQLLPISVFSQGRWENYSREVALLNPSTLCSFSDSDGTVWFGHENGVTKYDGQNYTQITSSEMLESSIFFSINEDSDGNVWFGSSDGALQFDGATFTKFTSFNGLVSETILAVLGDSKGGVWFGTNEGLSRLYNDQWTSFTEENGLLNNLVDCLHEDQDGNIWAGHEGSGMSVFDGSNWAHHEGMFVRDIINDPQGNILVAGQENVIFIYDGMTWKEGLKPGTTVYDMYYDSQGTLWMLGESGISRYDGENIIREVEEIVSYVNNEAICEDGNSNLFFVPTNNVYKYNDMNWSLISTWTGADVEKVIAIEEDIFGNMIFASGNSGGGVNSIQVLSDEGWHMPDYLNFITDKHVYDLLSVEDSVLWITGENIQFVRNDFHYEFVINMVNQFRKVFKDHENTIWACSDSGLFRFTGSSWIKENVHMNSFRDIAEDHDGNLWLGGSKVLKYDRVNAQKMVDIETSDIIVDSEGNIWISYEMAPGVAKFDGSQWTYFTDANGLHSNRVYDIFEDSRGNIWFATQNGIDKLVNGYWFHYDTSDGLVHNSVRKVFEDSKNQLWFGTQYGVSKLIPFSENVFIEVTHVTCTGGNDGAMDIQPEYLNPPYSYSIDGGLTFTDDSLYQDIIAGEYHVIVKDGNNDIAIDEFVVIEEPESDFNIVINNVSCYGMEDGSIDLTVEGDGVSPISFQWSNGPTSEDISNLAAGSYSVTISYDICEFTRDIIVKQPDTLEVSSIDYNICGGSLEGGADLIISGGNAPFTFTWSDGSTEENLDKVPQGIYYVDVMDENGCSTSDTVEILEFSESFDINIDASHGTFYCESMTVLNVPAGLESYLWVKDHKNFSDESMISPDGTGNYSVSVMNASHCRSRDTIQITNAVTYQNEKICMVTVDQSSGNNMILWNRTSGQSTNRYNIYRETEVTGAYDLIGQADFSSSGQFIDKNSFPDQQSYRYKLSLIDTCGNESSMSNHHSTIHLTRNLGVGLVVNLIWSNYEGFPVTTYNIWKGSTSTNLTKIGSVSGNNFTYTDQYPNIFQTYYAIEVVSPNQCNSGGKKSATLSSSFSNMVSVEITGIEEQSKGYDLLAYPNPFSSSTIIKIPENETGDLNLYVVDHTGRVVFETNDLRGPTYELYREGLSSGLYILKLSGQNTYLGKLMIE